MKALYYRIQADQYCAGLVERYKHDTLKFFQNLKHSRLKTTLPQIVMGIFNEDAAEALPGGPRGDEAAAWSQSAGKRAAVPSAPTLLLEPLVSDKRGAIRCRIS
jgi:hypothetical protein